MARQTENLLVKMAMEKGIEQALLDMGFEKNSGLWGNVASNIGKRFGNFAYHAPMQGLRDIGMARQKMKLMGSIPGALGQKAQQQMADIWAPRVAQGVMNIAKPVGAGLGAAGLGYTGYRAMNPPKPTMGDVFSNSMNNFRQNMNGMF